MSCTPYNSGRKEVYVCSVFFFVLYVEICGRSTPHGSTLCGSGWGWINPQHHERQGFCWGRDIEVWVASTSAIFEPCFIAAVGSEFYPADVLPLRCVIGDLRTSRLLLNCQVSLSRDFWTRNKSCKMIWDWVANPISNSCIYAKIIWLQQKGEVSHVENPTVVGEADGGIVGCPALTQVKQSVAEWRKRHGEISWQGPRYPDSSDVLRLFLMWCRLLLTGMQHSLQHDACWVTGSFQEMTPLTSGLVAENSENAGRILRNAASHGRQALSSKSQQLVCLMKTVKTL